MNQQRASSSHTLVMGQILTSRTSKRAWRRRPAAALCALIIMLGLGDTAGAVTIEWTGVLRVIIEDDGTGTYTGGAEDVSIFSGSVTYGDTCGSCLVEPFPPDEVNYVFLGGTGSLTGLGITTTGIESSVAISNDQIVDADAVALFAELGVSANLNDTIDVISIASETAMAEIEWEIEYIYLTTNPFTTTDYTSTPPANPDLVIFQVDDGDEEAYFAIGEVITVVPVPAAVWLFGAGLLGLVGTARRRASH